MHSYAKQIIYLDSKNYHWLKFKNILFKKFITNGTPNKINAIKTRVLTMTHTGARKQQRDTAHLP